MYFSNKKLKAEWLSPPQNLEKNLPDYVKYPRIFISEIEVEKLSIESQTIIRKYLDAASSLDLTNFNHLTNPAQLLWTTPSFSDYELLSLESEYAAWVLCHGYSLNHYALSLHRVLNDKIRQLQQQDPKNITAGHIPILQTNTAFLSDLTLFTNYLFTEIGFPMNTEGGLIKRSPDHLLIQSR